MTDSSSPIERLNAALEGRYVIERELGEGGMATVYLAKDLKHERQVALKVLKPELAAVVGADRFLTEIKTTANLQHPHILPLHDSGEADTFLFYVMPFVEGESLQDRLDRERQLHVDEAVKIATDLAEALDYAHRSKVIHRDIKPANILMHEGRPLIADFGIALAVGAAGGTRLTETGLSVGTPFYMSPEQATGDQILGAASDTYERHLCTRVCAVRDACGRAPLLRQHGPGGAREDHCGRTRICDVASAVDSSQRGRRAALCAGKASGRSLHVGAGVRRRS